MTARTDDVRSIRAARKAEVAGIAEGGAPALVAAGRLRAFRAGIACVAPAAQGVAIDSAAAALLGLSAGDTLSWVPRDLPPLSP